MEFNLAYFSLAIVAFILVFWGYFLIRRLVVLPARRKRLRERSRNNMTGTIVEKKVIRKQLFGKGSFVQLRVEFPNLNGARIQHTFNFIDPQPEQHRFDQGNSVDVILTDDPMNPVFLDAPIYQKLPLSQIMRIVLLGGFAFGCYMLYTNVWSAANNDFKTLVSRVDTLVVPLLGGIYLFVMVLIGIIFRAVGILDSPKKKKRRFRLQFHGQTALATVLNYHGTGTRVNNNPQVEISYSFNANGQTYEGSSRFIVDEVRVGELTHMGQIPILYLPENPAVNESETALQGGLLKGCTGSIFYFLAFVFSAVVLGLFIGTYF